ncbi:tetratricopeptide repeat protein, partial [candidate division WOR-3 bacterium]|nr:tetratricopeptide repeat protein [candidate division WOR-3 bacterium]
KPDDLDALYFTGEIYIKSKKYPDAIRYFEKATQLKEDDINAWFYLGVCYTQLKKYKKAIDIYENKVLQFSPENIDAMTNLAFIYSETGNSEKALEYLKKVEQLQ